MITIINKRKTTGKLFHYPHFICDCLYPEIINELYKYNNIIRIENIDQTLGNFKETYEDIMQNNSIELSYEEFKILGINLSELQK